MSARPRFSLALLLAVGTLAGAASACRSHTGLEQQYQQMRPYMKRGDWGKAAQLMEAAKDEYYEEEDRVMYWLNLGTVLHYAGQYDKSMEAFVKAEATIQDLWTTSISSEASKVVVNETIQDYGGEDFEKVLVYYFTAMNRVKQGKLSDALVEARRADEFLKKIQVQYEKEEEKVGTLYKQDAFMLWLVGLFYEVEGSFADAYLAYKTSYRAYNEEYAKQFGQPAPNFLKEDLVRTAELAGRPEDAAEHRAAFGGGGDSLQKAGAGMAEVVLLHGSGEAPFKKQKFIQGIMPDSYVLRIAIPEFRARKHQIRYAEMEVSGQRARTEPMEPITRIALDNYKHRLPAITARAIARATIKYVASKGAKKAVEGDGSDNNRKIAGALIGLFANIAGAASEQADLRAWTMLPSEVNATRMWVPAGDHTVTVRFYDAGGGEKSAPQQVSLTLKPGERAIVSVRTVR